MYLLGRDASVCDIVVNHSSVSKQHAVVLFRRSTSLQSPINGGGGGGGISASSRYNQQHTPPLNSTGGVGRPYLLDLASTNGTRLNGDNIPEQRYVELRTGDVVQFGDDPHDYVLVCDD